MAQPAADLISRLDACWEMGRTGQSTQGLATAQALLVEARKQADRPAIAFALTCNAWFCLQLGYPDEGISAIGEACLLYEELGYDWGQALSRAVYSWLLLEIGLSDLAFDEALAAVEAAERTDDMALHAFTMCCKGMALMICREDQLAFPALEHSLTLGETAGDICTMALCFINMGYSLMSQAELALANGDPAEATRLRERAAMLSDRAVDAAQSYGDLWNLRTALCNGAEAYKLLGKLALAHGNLDRWEALGGQTGPREEIHYLCTRGEVLTAEGRLEEALAVCRRAVSLATGSQIEHRAAGLRRLSEVEAAMGDHRAALEHFRAYHEAFVGLMGQLTRRRAQFAEMKLQNEKLRETARRLEAEAMQDPLTGLANRRAFEISFKALEGRSFSLAFLHLDHFKVINDRFSHMTGDAVLVRVGAILLAHEGVAHAFRMGGEEFALILENRPAGEAAQILEAIRIAIASASWSDLLLGHVVTASIGVVDTGELRGREMMGEADARLYAAKAAGRNTVIWRRRKALRVVGHSDQAG